LKRLGQPLYFEAVEDNRSTLGREFAMNEPSGGVFHPFDPDADVAMRKRNLPHWFQPGVAVFITFRTKDSLPRDVMMRMRRELEVWLRSKNFPIVLAESIFCGKRADHQRLLDALQAKDRQEFRKRAGRLIQDSLDQCHGACVLQQPRLARMLEEIILYDNGKKFDLESFVIMPNHVHAIVQFRKGFDFDVVGQSWMRYSARKINKEIRSSGYFWQPEPFDHLIRSPEQFSYLQRYIAENPNKAKLQPHQYLYWPPK
jgi:putative transposase